MWSFYGDTSSSARQRSGQSVGLAINGSQVLFLPALLSSTAHAPASVTKQHSNLVPVEGRWRPEAGKVTEDLASQVCVSGLLGSTVGETRTRDFSITSQMLSTIQGGPKK